MENIYRLRDTETLLSPSLIYYLDMVEENTRRIIDIAGGADRLWPHVKSHKCAEMVRMQVAMGICRFKTATVAEAEMVAQSGGKHILLAYPLIGPNIRRYLRLSMAYPDVVFYALGDDPEQMQALGAAACELGTTMRTMIDVNMGMNRSGIVWDGAQALYEQCCRIDGISMIGLHCYDGHNNNSDITARNASVQDADARVLSIRDGLRAKGLCCDLIIAGGTPSFPCHAQYSDFFLSPGTAFLGDMGYYNNLPDLAFTPAAAVFTRVVSHPAQGLFTLDLGYKGIASDPAGVRGVIVGMEYAKPVFQSEEHWVFSTEDTVPKIGSELYVIPTHICPTSALYPNIQIARNGALTGTWEVTARNRFISF